MYLSIVVPVFNEEQNITPLLEKIISTLDPLKKDYEILFVDDGSRDNTFSVLKQFAQKNKHIRVIKLAKNFGQTAALTAGFRHAKGDIIITMDGDLQNDPADIPKIVSAIEKGYDVVSGWRYNRKDPGLQKVLPSLIASFLRRRVVGDKVHDSGCSLKGYRRRAVKDLKLLGETHRFIPLILQWQGYKIGEIKVNHYPRKYGRTKYSFKRLWNGFMDILGLLFWRKYSTKPLYFFGAIGLFSIVSAFLLLLIVCYIAFSEGSKLVVGPLLLFTVVLFLGGMQILLMGIVADMQTRLYYSQKEIYDLEELVN